MDNRYDLKEHILRVTAALYRVTDMLEEEEPLKWSLRRSALEAVDSCPNLSNTAQFISAKSIGHCKGAVSSLKNKLLLAEAGGFVSRINFEVLGHEYALIHEELMRLEVTPVETTVSIEELASLPKNLQDLSSLSQNVRLTRSNQQPVAHKTQEETASPGKKITDSGVSTALNTPRILERQEQILRHIQVGQWLGLHEVRSFFGETVSEKTVQRDLIELYRQGVLKIDGKRRWRKYALVGKAMTDKNSMTDKNAD